MRVGIVGLPSVGKTTIFNLLTRGHADTSAWHGKTEAHIGVAQVPDPSLDRLAEIFRPEKVTYTTVEYVDVPGLARGEGKAALSGEAKEMSAYLNSLKNVDALMHVVRAFEEASIPHSEGSVNPARDIGLFELEMMFSDLAIVEKRLDRLEKDLKKAQSADLELEREVLGRFKEALEQEEPLRTLEVGEEETKRIKGFTFLSLKPLLLVLNLGDDEAAKIPCVVENHGLQERAAMRRVGITAACGKIESEIAALPPEEAAAFMQELGLAGSGLDRIIHESYALLGLMSFYTVGEPEVRAWTIPRGCRAVEAAGVIHTDFAKGFIKAEVVGYDDLVELRSFQAAKNKGVLRLEGKDYVLREKDVILFRFNV